MGLFLSVLPDLLEFLFVGLWFDYAGILHFSESRIYVWHFFKVACKGLSHRIKRWQKCIFSQLLTGLVLKLKTFLHQNINIIKDKKREGGGEEGWSTSEQTEEACSDTVIYNKKHTFGLCPLSQQSAPKTPGIAQVMATKRWKECLLFIKDPGAPAFLWMDFCKAPRMGTAGRGSTQRGLEPPPREGRGSGGWANHHLPMIWPRCLRGLSQTLNWEALGGEAERCWEVALWGTQRRSMLPTLLQRLPHQLFLTCILL